MTNATWTKGRFVKMIREGNATPTEERVADASPLLYAACEAHDARDVGMPRAETFAGLLRELANDLETEPDLRPAIREWSGWLRRKADTVEAALSAARGEG